MLTRRSLLAAVVAAAAAIPRRRVVAQVSVPAFSYPIGLPGRVLGDGFVIRHGYATENTWYNPGWLHTGEDWYAIEGDTAGAAVFAIADGEVVFAGSDYPGPVVIVRHAPDLFSMYGHLAYDLPVETGQRVARGARVGTVLSRTDGRAPSHLHFEIRTFLTIPEVNGEAPRYGVGCGFQCPPGPGYWPIDAPEHPSALGWRNPTHAINTPAATGMEPRVPAEVVVASGVEVEVSVSPRAGAGEGTGVRLPLVSGERYPLLDIDTGPVASTPTSAEGYGLWYRLALPDGDAGWVEGAVPTDDETGSDGRPSSIRFLLLPLLAGA